jgi:hypothetical protein
LIPPPIVEQQSPALGRRAIEPLLVVNHTDKWLRLRSIGEQVQDGQPDQEPVLYRSGAQAERSPEDITLRDR